LRTVNLVEKTGRRMVGRPADVRDHQALAAAFADGGVRSRQDRRHWPGPRLRTAVSAQQHSRQRHRPDRGVDNHDRRQPAVVRGHPEARTLANAFKNSLPVQLIEPEDVSETVLFLAANDSGRYYTGSTLMVDAGMNIA
jgi:hypothetical protein